MSLQIPGSFIFLTGLSTGTSILKPLFTVFNLSSFFKIPTSVSPNTNAIQDSLSDLFSSIIFFSISLGSDSFPFATTLHLPQIPIPLHGASMLNPAFLMASNKTVPFFTSILIFSLMNLTMGIIYFLSHIPSLP